MTSSRLPFAVDVDLKIQVDRAAKVVTEIQLFRQRLSHESAKAYSTMPIGSMGSKSLVLLD